jgi:hypothetical protein
VPESFNVLVKELQSLTLGVELIRGEGSEGMEEIDAEDVIASGTDAEVDDLGNEELIQGDEAVADMPLVDLAAGAEDEFEAIAEEQEEVTESAEA